MTIKFDDAADLNEIAGIGKLEEMTECHTKMIDAVSQPEPDISIFDPSPKSVESAKKAINNSAIETEHKPIRQPIASNPFYKTNE